MRDCLVFDKGETPAQYQLDILNDLTLHRRISVRGPHGLGKSAVASWIVLWFSLTRDGLDWKIPMTASVWRQLSNFLLPELHKWSRRVRWDKVKRSPFSERNELLALSLNLSTGSAFALASDNAEHLEGAHADHLLYLFDESKAIPVATWDAAEGAFSNAGADTQREAYAVSVSTPGEPNGRFYDIQAHKPGYEDWHVRHVTLAQAIAAGRISQMWAEQRLRQWGEKSAVYQNRVLGEFASSDETGVIPLSWIERANERWYEWRDLGKPGRFVCIGVDVARGGADKTVMAPRFDSELYSAIDDLRVSDKSDTMVTADTVTGILEGRGGYAVIDVIGVGAGVYDRVRQQKKTVYPFNASEHTGMRDKSGELGFINVRSAAWWHLREKIDPSYDSNVAIPPDDELTGDLTAPTWKSASGGKIQVEGKPDIKARIGRSTDRGDSVVMAMWQPVLYAPSAYGGRT